MSGAADRTGLVVTVVIGSPMLAARPEVFTRMTNALPSVDPAIIGFWQGVGGDYSLVDEYRADGTLVQYVGNRSSQPLPFRTEEGYVICSIEQPDHSIYEEKRRYEISGDTLTFIYSPRKKMHFQRRMEA